MKPLTIIVSDGIRTVAIIDGHKLNGVESVSFKATAGEPAQAKVDFSSLCHPFSEVDKDFLFEAAKQLGYEL